MAKSLSFKQSELTLFRGIHPDGGRVLILVAKDRMAISTDFGDKDPWVLKDHVENSYQYDPLVLSGFKNLTKIW